MGSILQPAWILQVNTIILLGYVDLFSAPVVPVGSAQHPHSTWILRGSSVIIILLPISSQPTQCIYSSLTVKAQGMANFEFLSMGLTDICIQIHFTFTTALLYVTVLHRSSICKTHQFVAGLSICILLIFVRTHISWIEIISMKRRDEQGRRVGQKLWFSNQSKAWRSPGRLDWIKLN